MSHEITSKEREWGEKNDRDSQRGQALTFVYWGDVFSFLKKTG